jgi:hypothetical protein
MNIAANSALPGEPLANPYTAADVEAILLEHGWLDTSATVGERAREWIPRAAALLGPQAADRAALTELLGLCFHYDALEILRAPATHAVLAREGARTVIRALALETIGGQPVDSDRFRGLIEAIKERVPYRSRMLFHPIRLALTGRVGEGELDRVILLLDEGAGAEGLATIKGVRQRMLEFCRAFE